MNSIINSFLLRPTALFYKTIMGCRNLAYDLLPGLSKAVALPIICVGNISSGGTGKTPMTAYLARHCQSLNLRVAILSRGYGRKNEKKQIIITSATDIESLTPEIIGDEALMLRRQLPGITLVLDADRVRGATAVVENDLADIILMDDGFQHRRLRRNFNLIMIDSQQIFGNGRTLPAGPLRESISSLKRADAIIFNKFDQRRQKFYALAAPVLNHRPPRRLFCAAYRYQKFTRLADKQELSLNEIKTKGPFCAVAGLANNDYFFNQLEDAGLKLAETMPFEDHHVYTGKDLINLKKTSRERPLITSAKDADKLRLATGAGIADKNFLMNMWVAEIDLKIDNEAKLRALLNDITCGKNRVAKV